MTRPSSPVPRPSAALPPAVLLIGPTAAGKSAVALELCERFALEIVSVDSAQIYRRMDIGTAKPDAATRRRHPHHLVDIIDPTESYSAARFRHDALALMHQITARGRVPLLVGGTMLYFKALREGLSKLPAANETTRQAIDAMATDRGWPALHGELARIDPLTAQRLDPNDAQRIQRALEIFYLTGKPMSSLLDARVETRPPFQLIDIALIPSDRTALHQRIAARFDAMIERGLIAEVEALRRDPALRATMPSMRCVGYRQVWQYLDGEFDWAMLRDKGIAATRQLAKRQFTWLRATRTEAQFDPLARQPERTISDWLARRLALHG